MSSHYAALTYPDLATFKVSEMKTLEALEIRHRRTEAALRQATHLAERWARQLDEIAIRVAELTAERQAPEEEP